MNKRLPNLLMLMTIYLAACLSMQACSSMTDRVLKPSSLQKGSSYAEIRVKSANGISGAPMGFSTDDDLAYSKWEMIDGGDSAMKQVGKTLFSITP